MTGYKSYYYVIRKGKSWEIYSTCCKDWMFIKCYESYDEALKAINEKQTRA